MASADRPDGPDVIKAPIWRSAFRPFFLAAAIYGPLLIISGLGSYFLPDIFMMPAYPPALFHGHEMIFGFAGAMMAGFALTALPSWAGAKAITGAPLAFLIVLWLLGRIAVWFSAALPPPLVATVDASFFLALGVLVAPTLFKVRQKIYCGFLLIVTGMFAAQVFFHYGVLSANADVALSGVMAGTYVVIVLFSIVGGFLTPVFTERHLRGQGWHGRIRFIPALEILAVASAVLFGLTGLFASETLAGAAAIFAFVVHLLRLSRWKTRRILDTPILWVMHAAYGWLILTFVLRALGDFWGLLPAMAPIHAFTIGALSLMKMGLMTRVVLRHTGRPVEPRPFIVSCFYLLIVAAVARVASTVSDQSAALRLISLIFWLLPFLAYLWTYGPLLWRPSLPEGKRKRRNAEASTEGSEDRTSAVTDGNITVTSRP